MYVPPLNQSKDPGVTDMRNMAESHIGMVVYILQPQIVEPLITKVYKSNLENKKYETTNQLRLFSVVPA